MRRSWRSFSLVVFPAVLATAAVLTAQTTDDLPAAPSEVIKPKPAPPKKADPPEQQQEAQPKQSPQDASPQTADTATSNDGSAPQPKQQEEPVLQGPTIPVRVNEVSVVFTVTDKHNRYIKDLTRNDFKVIDDQKPVEEIRSFRRETDLPLHVGLLIDASNSIRGRFKFEQESAIEFLNQIIRRRYDQAFVLGFDVESEVTQDFTDNTEALAKGIRALKPGGGTAMYDALYYACRDKLLKSPQAGSVRRAIILVSDGDDNQSHVTREEAIDMALRANVIVYTISTNFPNGGGPGDKVLQRIADATGGRAFQPFQIQEVSDAFAQIQADLRSQYELAYRPQNLAHDGRFRSIEISALRKGLKVRSRNGYYAPGQ